MGSSELWARIDGGGAFPLAGRRGGGVRRRGARAKGQRGGGVALGALCAAHGGGAASLRARENWRRGQTAAKGGALVSG